MIENLNYYRIFFAVAEAGSVSKAAERLFISQPAVSKSVSLLEKELKCRLFDRSRKGVNLTNEGRTLYEHLKTAFKSISEAEERLTRDLSLGVGELKIGVSNTLCRHILIDNLKTYINNKPHIKVSIHCHATIDTVKLLSENEVDIGLICETDLPQDMDFLPIRKIHDTFVASSTYLDNLMLREKKSDENTLINPWLLAGNITAMTKSETKINEKQTNYSLSPKEILEKGNLMLLEKGNVTRNHIENYLYQHSIIPEKILDINDMDLLIDFAKIGLGISSIVREFATEALQEKSIVEIPLIENVTERNIGFAFKKTKKDSPIIRDFLSYDWES